MQLSCVSLACVQAVVARCLSVVALAQVEGVMEEMRGRGIAPTAVTYGCALAACEARRDAGAAVALYHEACAAGVPPSDIVHDALIKACVAAGRLDEALDAIKRLMRANGEMQAHTFNSVTRALCDQYIGADRSTQHSIARLVAGRPALRLVPSLRSYCELQPKLAWGRQEARCVGVFS